MQIEVVTSSTTSLGWHTYLLLAAAKHGNDGEANASDRQSRSPIVPQQGQANVAIAINVRVDRDAVPNKHNLEGNV